MAPVWKDSSFLIFLPSDTWQFTFMVTSSVLLLKLQPPGEQIEFFFLVFQSSWKRCHELILSHLPSLSEGNAPNIVEMSYIYLIVSAVSTTV